MRGQLCHQHQVNQALVAISGFLKAEAVYWSGTILFLAVSAVFSLDTIHEIEPKPCLGDPCNKMGKTLNPFTGPPPLELDEDKFFPFTCPEEFLLANFLYKKVQMSAGDISYLMKLWGAYQH
jgi:hypothetical protein